MLAAGRQHPGRGLAGTVGRRLSGLELPGLERQFYGDVAVGAGTSLRKTYICVDHGGDDGSSSDRWAESRICARSTPLRASSASRGRLRFDFSDYLHELKVGGDLGSKPRGDFTTDELRERARWFKQERFGDDA